MHGSVHALTVVNGEVRRSGTLRCTTHFWLIWFEIIEIGQHLQKSLPPPRRLCFHLCLSVCLSVEDNIPIQIQRILNC